MARPPVVPLTLSSVDTRWDGEWPEEQQREGRRKEGRLMALG